MSKFEDGDRVTVSRNCGGERGVVKAAPTGAR